MSEANPFRSGMLSERPADPCVLVIFGATGDLAQRKLFPSLAHLLREGRISEQTQFLAVSRSEIDQEEFRQTVLSNARKLAPQSVPDDEFARRFADKISTVFDDGADGKFDKLRWRLGEISGAGGPHNYLIYLSIPPTAYAPTISRLGAVGLATPEAGAWSRIIIEKPFGRDYDSAEALNSAAAAVFREEQIYRIDHYLGKETVQNILVLRLANTLFEPIWNLRYVDHVQITAAESLGVEERAQYYEESGALRDMIQNHLMQILSMIAMERPASLAPEAIRDEKKKVLEAVRPIQPRDVANVAVRAQYSAGAVAGKTVPGYLEDNGVKKNSRTETFAALKLHIDNWRWSGVPFYLRTGKRLAKRATEVAIVFRKVPLMVFSQSPVDRLEQNVLTIRIQPNEGISLKFEAKLPGHALHVRPVEMDFRYGTTFGERLSDAYERLLLDAMIGDQTLFARRDSVEEGWRIVQPILDVWAEEAGEPLPQYVAGSWGPTEADVMLAREDHRWRKL
ncbi:MAG: glucose-6-phosphate dehydrogenase [Calditrichaeota bacterium]|nr:glucose-6-phosphate dehydrogenase [Calditrichota bacterium]